MKIIFLNLVKNHVITLELCSLHILYFNISTINANIRICHFFCTIDSIDNLFQKCTQVQNIHM